MMLVNQVAPGLADSVASGPCEAQNGGHAITFQGIAGGRAGSISDPNR